jgi:hypothetical protein
MICTYCSINIYFVQDLKGAMNGRAACLRKHARKIYGLTKKPKLTSEFAAWVEKNREIVLK